MKIRAALPEAEKANVALGGVTTIFPVGLVGSSVKKLTTGSHAFVGKAAAEVEIRSATNNELLAAAVSRRVGGKTIASSKLSSWGDVEAAADKWAEDMRERLTNLRTGKANIQFAE